MEEVFEIFLKRYELFLLILVRTSGIFFISPFFSSQNVPNTIKAGFSLILSIILTMVMDINIDILDTPLPIIIFKELMVGLMIGFISYIFFTTFYVMGQIIDMKIGFGLVNVIDPQHRVQVPLLGNFYYILAFLLFLSINGHHIIIDALVDSYEFIPIGNFRFTQDIVNLLLDIVSYTFSIGFRIGAPVVAIIFLLDILLGILARTIPQMNVFVVGMPFKILIGLIIVGLTIPIFYSLTNNVFNNMVEKIYYFLKLFVEG